MKSPNLQNHLATKKCEHFPMDIKDCFSPHEMTTKPATSPSTLTLLCTMHGMEHLALERDFERIDVAGPFLKFIEPKQPSGSALLSNLLRRAVATKQE